MSILIYSALLEYIPSIHFQILSLIDDDRLHGNANVEGAPIGSGEIFLWNESDDDDHDNHTSIVDAHVNVNVLSFGDLIVDVSGNGTDA